MFYAFVRFRSQSNNEEEPKGVYRIFPFFTKIINFVLYFIRCHKTL